MFKVILGSFGALVSKWPVIWKRLAVERNGVKFACRFWPFSVKVILGSFVARVWKWSEILESWIIVICIPGTYGLLVFKVNLGSFGALVSKWPVTGKQLAVERNEVKFGTFISKTASCTPKQTQIWASRLLSAYAVLLTVKCSRSFWGHSVHFWYLRCPTTLYLGKRLVVKETGYKFGPQG